MKEYILMAGLALLFGEWYLDSDNKGMMIWKKCCEAIIFYVFMDFEGWDTVLLL
jgi:hypothetical protein